MSGIFFTAFSSRKPLTPETQVSVKSPVFHEESPSTPPSKDLSPAKANAASFSLKEMSKILFQHTVTGGKLEDLVKDLKKTRQEPFLVRDKNDETGEMIIVRTKSPLPGTRYFHAQYFTDETMQAFAQHMSFELHASPQAMNQAIQTVKEAFPNLDAPSEESRDFIQWDLEDGYVIWIKRLGAEDIQENPFNFYSAEDIGSIRIAVELAPEGD
jgi:hypothetical protein